MNQIRAARSPWILWIAAAAFALVTLACETGEPAAPPSEDEIAANTATATAEPPADSAGTAAPAPTAATTAAPPTDPPQPAATAPAAATAPVAVPPTPEQSYGEGEAGISPKFKTIPDPVTLSFGYPFPAKHPLRLQVLEPWAADVSAATAGSVTIEFHAEQALSPAAETYANVAAGGQDIGWALQGYSAGRFPATAVMEMPFVFDSSSEATAAFWAVYEEFEALRNDYHDVKILGLWTTGPGDLWVAEGVASTKDDIAGLTIRSSGPVQAEVIKALGANPVSMAAPELRGALEAGEIDGLLTVDTALATHNLTDVLESGIECGCYVLASFMVMNLDAWNILSPDQQAAMEDLSGKEVSEAAAMFYDKGSATAAEKNAAAGITKVLLEDAELERWKEATRGIADEWVTANSGQFDGRAMYLRMLELAAN